MSWARPIGAAVLALLGVTAVAVPVTAQTTELSAVNDSATVRVDGSVEIDVLANDLPEGAVTLQNVSDPRHGATSIVDGVVLYEPDEGYAGMDTFAYIAMNGSSLDAGIVTVVVLGEGSRPVAHGDVVATDEGAPVSIDVLENDEQTDGASTVSIQIEPDNGAVGVDDETQEVVYRPNAGFSGSDTFTYRIEGDNGASNPATVIIEVGVQDASDAEPDGDGPVAENDAVSVAPGEPVAIEVLENDEHPDGDDLMVVLQSAPSHGTLSVGEGARTLTYRPSASFTGEDQFTYQASDGSMNSNTATVTIEVTRAPPDDATEADELDPRVVRICEAELASESLCDTYLGGQLPPSVQSGIARLLLRSTSNGSAIETACEAAGSGRVSLLCDIWSTELLPDGLQRQLGGLIVEMADEQ